MITTSLYLRNRDQGYLPAVGWSDAIRAVVERDPQYYDDADARIEICIDGKPANTFDDSLGPMVQNLCLIGAQNLIEGKSYTFRFWSYNSEIRMLLQDQVTAIEGEFCGSGVYPTHDLIQALIGCAADAITFLKTVQSNLAGSRVSPIENLEKLYRETQEMSG